MYYFYNPVGNQAVVWFFYHIMKKKNRGEGPIKANGQQVVGLCLENSEYRSLFIFVGLLSLFLFLRQYSSIYRS